MRNIKITWICKYFHSMVVWCLKIIQEQNVTISELLCFVERWKNARRLYLYVIDIESSALMIVTNSSNQKKNCKKHGKIPHPTLIDCQQTRRKRIMKMIRLHGTKKLIQFSRRQYINVDKYQIMKKKTQQRNVKPIKQKEQTNERKNERMNYAKLHWGDLHTLLFEIITVALFDADNITALHSTKWIIDSILLLWLALICVEKKLSGDSLRKGKAQ